MTKPLLSIVIATFNADKYLDNCIESIKQQSLSEQIEIILVDGGSTDKTLDIPRKYKDLIIKIISEPDQGIYDAWNKGIRLSSAEWVIFMGADDRWILRDSLEKLLGKTLLKDVNLITCYGIFFDEMTGRKRLLNGKYYSNDLILGKGIRFVHPGALHKRELLNKHSGFDESFKIAADHNFFFKAIKDIRACEYEDYLIEIGANGISNTKIIDTMYEGSRVILKNMPRSYIKSIKFFLLGVSKFYLRKLVH